MVLDLPSHSDQASNFYALFDLMSLIHLFLFVGLVSLQAAASFSPGSRSILRDIGSNNADQKDNAIELNATNFDSVFQDSTAKYAVLKFFAHWSVSSFSLSLIDKSEIKIQPLVCLALDLVQNVFEFLILSGNNLTLPS